MSADSLVEHAARALGRRRRRTRRSSCPAARCTPRARCRIASTIVAHQLELAGRACDSVGRARRSASSPCARNVPSTWPGSRCQSASVTNGTIGCSRRSAWSNACTSTARATSRSSPGVGEPRLDRLEIPVGELVPHEAARRLGVLVEPQPGVALVRRVQRAVASGAAGPSAASHSAIAASSARGSMRRRASARRDRCSASGCTGSVPTFVEQEAADVPELRDEVAARRERLLEVVRVEHDVGAQAHAGDHRVAQRVGAVERARRRADRCRCRATSTSCDASCRARCRAGTPCGTARRP